MVLPLDTFPELEAFRQIHNWINHPVLNLGSHCLALSGSKVLVWWSFLVVSNSATPAAVGQHKNSVASLELLCLIVLSQFFACLLVCFNLTGPLLICSSFWLHVFKGFLCVCAQECVSLHLHMFLVFFFGSFSWMVVLFYSN